jgi:hypothetical protein
MAAAGQGTGCGMVAVDDDGKFTRAPQNRHRMLEYSWCAMRR